jgi:hypothetical protein
MKKAAQMTGRHSKQKMLQARIPLPNEAFERRCSKKLRFWHRSTAIARFAGSNRIIPGGYDCSIADSVLRGNTRGPHDDSCFPHGAIAKLPSDTLSPCVPDWYAGDATTSCT